MQQRVVFCFVQIVKKAVKSDGMALQYASEECQAEKDLVMKAVEQNGLALQFAASRLRDKSDVCTLMKKWTSNTRSRYARKTCACLNRSSRSSF